MGDVLKKIAALNSPVRLKILRLLAKEPMTNMELVEALSSEKKLFRESIYRSLDKLVEAGLVKKVYDQDHKKLKYHLIDKKIEIRFD